MVKSCLVPCWIAWLSLALYRDRGSIFLLLLGPLLWRCGPTRAMTSSFTRFLDHTLRHTTVGRTSLDEWSARRTDLYLTTHINQHRQTSMPSCGIRTHNPSKRAAVDPSLRPSGHWDRLLLLWLLSSSSSSSPLYRVFILIFLRQTMSLGNTVLQLFCCYYSWCLYR